MTPIITIVGRTNVGKSTLFNKLTGTRKALVVDKPGITRDRLFGECIYANKSFTLIDTGGFEFLNDGELFNQVYKQTKQAIYESDIVIFLVDGKLGICPADIEIAKNLRKSNRPVFVVVNKLEGRINESLDVEFFELGLGKIFPISASHGDGVKNLISEIFGFLIAEVDELNSPKIEIKEKEIFLSIVGRPNVGKSTLVNKFLGEERVVTYDMPGTTRDTVTIPFVWKDKRYFLVDTAGIKRSSKITNVVDKFSVVKTIQAIQNSNVVLFLLDADHGITEQDSYIASLIMSSGPALVVGVNKWDKVNQEGKDNIKQEIKRKLNYLSWAEMHYFSAIKGQGLSALMTSVEKAFNSALVELSTNKLNLFLKQITNNHPPPLKNRFRPKLRYVHQGGKNPPIIIVHGTGLHKLGQDYKRYLENSFRKKFDLKGTPVKIEWKNSLNPFHER